MKLVCNNSECKKYNEAVISHAVSFKVKKGHLVSNQTCTECGRPLIDACPEIKGDFTVNFLRTESLSPQERKEILKKRSNDHFNKYLKEKKEYSDANII